MGVVSKKTCGARKTAVAMRSNMSRAAWMVPTMKKPRRHTTLNTTSSAITAYALRYQCCPPLRTPRQQQRNA